jgi:acetyl-CoA C-acetyltransferase
LDTEQKIVITAAKRTPMCAFQGELSPVPAPALGAMAIRAALDQTGLNGLDVDEVLMGCVLPAALGMAPARQASIAAGIPDSIGATTINKVCGSGMKAAILGHDMIRAGSAEVMVTGGMESMSNAPYLLDKARSGYRLGHGKLIDHMFVDGLEDAYDPGRLMGTFAEATAEAYQFTREAQDAFSIESLRRAQKAQTDGAFDDEITPVKVTSRKGDMTVETDEQPRTAKAEKIPTLKPAFQESGTVTAANSSSISDGAAALVLMGAEEADRRNIESLAVIRGHASHACPPEWFTTAPIGAVGKLLENVGWTTADVDLFEINEAFSVVTMAAMHDLALPHEKVNIHGGACALGHPLGCSGARLIVTLLAALARNDLKRGVASLCIGGGEAVAIAVERMS